MWSRLRSVSVARFAQSWKTRASLVRPSQPTMDDAKSESDGNQDAPSVDPAPSPTSGREEDKNQAHAQEGRSRGRGLVVAPFRRFFSQPSGPRRGDCACSMP